MEAIVLAGGLGTRLRSVVADVPKPMAPVANRPFLDYILYLVFYYLSLKIIFRPKLNIILKYRHGKRGNIQPVMLPPLF